MKNPNCDNCGEEMKIGGKGIYRYYYCGCEIEEKRAEARMLDKGFSTAPYDDGGANGAKARLNEYRGSGGTMIAGAELKDKQAVSRGADGKFYPLPTEDEKPLQLARHPQLTPLWKRVLQFFRRPRMTETNLENVEDLFSDCVSKSEVREVIDKEISGTCKVCEKEAFNRDLTDNKTYCTKNHDAIEEFYKRKILSVIKQKLEL